MISSVIARLAAWWRNQFPGTAAPAADVKPRLKIAESILARARGKFSPATPVKVFGLPDHPPGVGPAAGGPKLAMDSDIGAVQSWANGFAEGGLNSFWSEGVTFLGYAYLAELAQRPEYRVISETNATEMTRKWIRFTSKGDEDKADKISELEDEFNRLNVRNAFCRATEQDGFFGRGHIYIDTGDSKNPEELAQAIGDGWNKLSRLKIGKGSIKALRTVEAVWCYPTSYNSNDPLQENWFRPDSWFVQAKTLHASRLLTFIGREVPDLLKPTYSFGGVSLSQLAKPYVDNWLKTRQSVNDIISSFTVFVLLSNMLQSMQGDGDELFKRADLFNLLRNNRGLMLLDKDSEDFKNVSASLAGLHELQAKAQELLCFPAHCPVVKLLGQQPAGLNADSEGVMRSYYDYIHAFQEHLYRDKIHRLMGLVMINLWGEPDPDIGFEFVPLWSLDEKAEAEVEKIKAETSQILIDSSQLSPEEGRARVAADPGSDYSSIDVEDVPDLREEEEEGLEPVGGRPDPLAEHGGEGENGGEPESERKAA